MLNATRMGSPNLWSGCPSQWLLIRFTRNVLQLLFSVVQDSCNIELARRHFSRTRAKWKFPSISEGKESHGRWALSTLGTITLVIEGLRGTREPNHKELLSKVHSPPHLEVTRLYIKKKKRTLFFTTSHCIRLLWVLYYQSLSCRYEGIGLLHNLNAFFKLS